MNRRDFAATIVGSLTSRVVTAGPTPGPPNLGLLLYSYGQRARAEKERGFSEPVPFIRFAHERGANAVQMPLGIRTVAESQAIRRVLDTLGMHVEGIVAPPRDDAADRERFTAELETARACGAEVVRTVLLGGRRYEVFDRADDYDAFVRRSIVALQRAEPVARSRRIVLAVENHKDLRTDEQVDMLRRFGSDWIGACVDTGNNLALLEDPLTPIEALAPFVRTVHLKDIGLEPAPDGFRMAEVPLGEGILDLARIVTTLRRANPKVRFQLEMITRDPLSIPCLTEKYWATLERVPGRDLARSLQRAQASKRPAPLPRVEALAVEHRLAAEDHNVRASFAHAARVGLVPT